MSIKQIFKTLSIFAMIFWITACGDNNDNTSNRTVEILKIKEIWQGDIPEKFKVNSSEQCRNDAMQAATFLLLPEKISATEKLHVTLYGCINLSGPNDPVHRIDGEDNVIDCYVFYKGLNVNQTNKDQILLTAQQHIYQKPKELICVTSGMLFKKLQTYDINGSWQSGELQVIIQNPDDKNLSATIIVE